MFKHNHSVAEKWDQNCFQPPVLSPTPLPPFFRTILSSLDVRNKVWAVSLEASPLCSSPLWKQNSEDIISDKSGAPWGLWQLTSVYVIVIWWLRPQEEAVHPWTWPQDCYCGRIVSLDWCRQGFPGEETTGEFSLLWRHSRYNIGIGENREGCLTSVVTLPGTST